MNQIQETPLSKKLALISGVTKRLDVELPLFLSPMTVGYPSPTDDFSGEAPGPERVPGQKPG